MYCHFFRPGKALCWPLNSLSQVLVALASIMSVETWSSALQPQELLELDQPQSWEDLRQQDTDEICSGTGECCQAWSQEKGDWPCPGHARRDSKENAAVAALINMFSSAADTQDNSASDPSAASACCSIAALVDTDTDEAIQLLQCLQLYIGNAFQTLFQTVEVMGIWEPSHQSLLQWFCSTWSKLCSFLTERKLVWLIWEAVLDNF